MNILVGLVVWSIMILGALPESGQRELEYRIGWWHPRFMGLISSFVEAFSGWQLLRSVLFRSELGVLDVGWAVALGGAGLFLLAEGLVRLGVTMKLRDTVLPSLPVALLYRGLLSITRN